jgi:transposase
MDLARLGFSKVEAAATGRPACAPGDLLKLYLYGYLNQVRSSRRLEREARRNLEVLWLIGRVSPSFKTIADFRTEHAKAIVGVCRAFIAFCRSQAQFGAEALAIDGAKIAAVASRKKVVTPKKLAEQMRAVERKIADHLTAMDEADKQEDGAPADRVDVKAVLAELAARREAIERQAEEMKEQGLSRRVVGEEEARLMRTPNHGHQVAYNAQIAVDAANHLIVAFDLTNEGNDQRLLHPMAEQGKQALGADSVTVVADTGYSNGEHGERCEEAQTTAIVPRAQTVNPGGEQYFDRDRFADDAASDSYRCPAAPTLRVGRVSHAKETKEYWNSKACQACALEPQGAKAARRAIVRSFHEDAREAMHRRATSGPRWMTSRKSVVEHPFGTMKWMLGHPRFLIRGLVEAKAEPALVALGYNLKRAINLLGAPHLLVALRAATV